MHDDDIPFSTARAADLVARALPRRAAQRVRALSGAGTDNWLFRVGDDAVLRVPRRPSAKALLARECTFLPRFDALPLTIPAPLAYDLDTDMPWALYAWLPGTPLLTRPDRADAAAAVALGGFLRALQAQPGLDGPIAGSTNHHRGTPLQVLDPFVIDALPQIGDLVPVAHLHDLWAQALAVPAWDGAPVWLHGDLHGDNLLANDGRLSGVIDFGLMGRGDPAADLTPAWLVFPPAHRPAFLDAAGHDRDTIHRGRGWALYWGIIALAYYRSRNLSMARRAQQAITAVLDDAAF